MYTSNEVFLSVSIAHVSKLTAVIRTYVDDASAKRGGKDRHVFFTKNTLYSCQFQARTALFSMLILAIGI